MKIIVDAMGGDNAPEEIAMGALAASKEFDIEVVLVGDETALRVMFAKKQINDLGLLEIVNAPDKITMEDPPATAIREKPESSMAVALRLLSEGYGDALVSAGNTGALLTGATLIVKRIKGIRRAALASMLPNEKGKYTLLMDCGANVECTAEYLIQFAFMGSVYARLNGDGRDITVGLVNNGTEDSKGTSLYKQTNEILKKAAEEKLLDFCGNVEGRDIVSGNADVVVCDGFTGNIILKTIEGVAKMMYNSLEKMIAKSMTRTIGALMLKSGFKEVLSQLDYTEVGGAPFIGISKPVIKAHGSSNDTAIKNAIKQAMIYACSGTIEAIEANIDKLNAMTAVMAAAEEEK